MGRDTYVESEVVDVLSYNESLSHEVCRLAWRLLAKRGLVRLSGTFELLKNDIEREADRSMCGWERRRGLKAYRNWTGLPTGRPAFDPITILEYGDAYEALVTPLRVLEECKSVGLWRVRDLLGIPTNMEGLLYSRWTFINELAVGRAVQYRIYRGPQTR